MILYNYGCACGNRFEAFVANMSAPNPSCPECGGETNRMPARVNFGGQADPGPSRDELPRSWRGVGNGDRETIRHFQRVTERREKLEDKYPELAGDRRPVLAHEGIFEKRPLRAGDDIATAVKEAAAAAKAVPEGEPK